MDRYLDFNSNHPISATPTVVEALSDRAKNVCSSPELLTEEMDHLCKVQQLSQVDNRSTWQKQLS